MDTVKKALESRPMHQVLYELSTQSHDAMSEEGEPDYSTLFGLQCNTDSAGEPEDKEENNSAKEPGADEEVAATYHECLDPHDF